MFKDIPVYLLNTSEFYFLYNNIIHHVEDSELAEAPKTKIKERLNKHFPEFKASANKLLKNPFTKILKIKDDKRDHSFLCFRTYIEYLTYHWDETIAAAAKAILEIIRRHGWSLHSEGYKTQTAKEGYLIEELSVQENQELLNTANAIEHFNRLKDSEQEFEQAAKEKESKEAEEVPLLIETKKLLYNSLLKCFNYIETLKEFEDEQGVDKLIDEINQSIISVTTTAKARKTRNESEDEEESLAMLPETIE